MIKINKQSKFSKYRKSHGSQIAELPPALILLLIAFFFPLMNMLYLVCTYGAGWYLNSMQAREIGYSLPASIGMPPGPPDGAYHSVILPSNFRWNGVFGITEDVNSPQVAQFPPANNPNLIDRSRVRTTINVQPLVRMRSIGSFLPLGNIPGLGKPWIFTYTSETPQEQQEP